MYTTLACNSLTGNFCNDAINFTNHSFCLYVTTGVCTIIAETAKLKLIEIAFLNMKNCTRKQSISMILCSILTTLLLFSSAARVYP